MLSIEALFRLDGEVALVTGAGGGLGRIAALALAGAGARVAVTDIDGDAAETVAAEIKLAGGTAMARRLDVADRGQVIEVIDRAADELGGLHVLVNNAGITRRGPSETMPDEDWDAVVEVNLTAQFMCSRAAARHMLAEGNGRIITIASIVGLRGNAFFPHLAYQATKGALVNKVATVMSSTATQHGGAEMAIVNAQVLLQHHGFIIVPLSYAYQGQSGNDVVRGGSPYGMTTTSDTDGSRQPSEQELEGAKFQGKRMAEITAKLHG